MSKDLADHLIALKTDRLRTGMFVAELDRLWLHTPFPPDGFYIKDEKLIDRIGRYCTYVYIDPLKSQAPDDVVVPFEPINMGTRSQPDQHDVGVELPWARLALDKLNDSVRSLIRGVRQGLIPDIDALTAGLNPAIDSIQRCPDALLWLLRTEPMQGYLYRRAIGTALTAAAFGHRLGFDRQALRELALGGLLLDIGKIEIPITLLAKPEHLTPEEFVVVRRHVSHGLELMQIIGNVPVRVMEMVSSHHERFDGSGYPAQQCGAEIPLFARIAGIVDTFDAITQNRRYAPAISAHTALRYLSGQRRSKFDGALTQEFINAMGVYPTGTWVELLDGCIGIVCAQDPRWPLAPRVAVLKDNNGKRIEPRVAPASRMNPIICAHQPDDMQMSTPNLEAIA
jgi:hypothetical protein